jgi:hypothetical protein
VNEVQLVFDAFDQKGILPEFPGLWVNGKRYRISEPLNETSRSLYLTNHAGGGCMTATHQLIVIGLWDSGINPHHTDEGCRVAVEDLAGLLMKDGL